MAYPFVLLYCGTGNSASILTVIHTFTRSVARPTTQRQYPRILRQHQRPTANRTTRSHPHPQIHTHTPCLEEIEINPVHGFLPWMSFYYIHRRINQVNLLSWWPQVAGSFFTFARQKLNIHKHTSTHRNMAK